MGCWEDCALGTWWRGKKSLRIGVWGGVTRGQSMFGKCVGYGLAGGFGCGVWRFGMWYSISVSPAPSHPAPHFYSCKANMYPHSLSSTRPTSRSPLPPTAPIHIPPPRRPQLAASAQYSKLVNKSQPGASQMHPKDQPRHGSSCAGASREHCRAYPWGQPKSL